jgi:hypothetical protein
MVRHEHRDPVFHLLAPRLDELAAEGRSLPLHSRIAIGVHVRHDDAVAQEPPRVAQVERRLAQHHDRGRLESDDQCAALSAAENRLRVSGEKERDKERAARRNWRPDLRTRPSGVDGDGVTRLADRRLCGGNGGCHREEHSAKNHSSDVHGFLIPRVLAGVHGNRTHPTRRRQVTLVLKTREATRLHPPPFTQARGRCGEPAELRRSRLLRGRAKDSGVHGPH